MLWVIYQHILCVNLHSIENEVILLEIEVEGVNLS